MVSKIFTYRTHKVGQTNMKKYKIIIKKYQTEKFGPVVGKSFLKGPFL